MDRQFLSSKLIDLTGSLLPTPNTSITDLQDVRRSLAFSLSREQPEPRESRSLVETFNQAPIQQIESSVMSELQEIADQTINQLKERPTGSPEFRIFRRELPILTSQDPASVPPWAAGLAIERTVGPFVDLSERPVWFDFYRIVQQVQVVRLPGAQPFLILPLRGLLIQNSASYSLPAGSIWIASQLLTSSAPAGSYTGLRILGGTFSLSTPATVTAGVLQVASGVTCTLTIQIEQPGTTGTIFGPGVDASNLIVQLPAEVTFEFSPTGISITTAADASTRLYGTEIQLQNGKEAPVYEPALNRILIPYGVTQDQFEIVECRSNLFPLSGVAPIKGGAWALPVAISDPISLGEASGAGAVVITVEPGLRGQWQGLPGNPVKLNNAFLMVEPRRLVVVALQAKNSRATQTFILWRESPTNSPRNSSVEVLYEKPIVVRYFSQQTGVEALITTGTAIAHLDRPLQADASRLSIRMPSAVNLLYEDNNGIFVLLNGLIPEVFGIASIPQPKIALALSNALLKTTPVRALSLFGKLQTDNQLENGSLRLNFGLYLLLPTLPDPYAANISVFRGRDSTDRLTAILIATVQWDTPEVSSLSFAFASLSEMSAATSFSEIGNSTEVSSFGQNIASTNQGLSSTRLLGIGREEIEKDRQETQNLREQFDETLGSVQEQFLLLDVSSNADQLGVGVGFANRRDVQTTGFPVQINGVDLVTAGQNVRIFTVPEIQWEPVRTIQNSKVKPFPFPSPLLSADDGGSTLIGVNTVNLVPIAPRPVLEQIVSEFNSETDSKPVAALFTLPFGMKAVARLRKVNFDQIQDDILPLRGSELALNQPNFPNRNLIGSLQLSAIATLNPLFKEFVEESPYLEGATIQLRNGVNSAGVPLVDDNGVPLSVLGPEVDVIFNQEFAPTGKNPRVPVTRIDFSGYGASMFSNWSNPNAELPATVKVRFDVMVGRTAYEVIQVKSVVFPCCAVFVRTITIQRTNSGGIVRSDSGWVPATPGLYKYHKDLKFHPGVVKGFFNIRNIRDTSQVYEKNGIKLSAVYFDADIQIDDPIRGATNGLVSSPNQLGFVLLSLPLGQPYLTPEQLAELLKSQGTLGGGVDCVVDVGKSGQHMRVTRVDFSTALTLGGKPIFAGAARGSLALPGDGAWSITQQTADEPQVLDLNFGVPLIREGEASVVLNPAYNNPNPLRFADPADLLRSNNPVSDYGLLFSTDTQRLLFSRPKIETGSRQITSTERPLLADMYSLMTAVGIFPKASNCIPVPTSNFALEIQAGGGFKLVLPFTDNKFAVTPFTRNIANSPPVRTYAEYADDGGNQTEITIHIDSLASPGWSFKMSPVSVVLDFDPFEKLMRIVGTVEGQSGVQTQIIRTENTQPKIVLGSVLRPIQEIITIIEDLGLPLPIPLVMSNAASGNGRSYRLRVKLKFKPLGENGIEVGCGKLKAKLEIVAEFFVPTDLSKTYVSFFTSLSGSLQTAIIPKLLYAGGFFKFEPGFMPADLSRPREERESAIKLAIGIIGSIGSKELIPRVLGIEGDTKRCFFIKLIDGKVKPGLLVGGSVTLILLNIPPFKVAGIRISFELEAQGTVYRSPNDNDIIRLDATASIAFSISLGFFLEISVEYKVPFVEDLSAKEVAGLGLALSGISPLGGAAIAIL